MITLHARTLRARVYLSTCILCARHRQRAQTLPARQPQHMHRVRASHCTRALKSLHVRTDNTLRTRASLRAHAHLSRFLVVTFPAARGRRDDGASLHGHDASVDPERGQDDHVTHVEADATRGGGRVRVPRQLDHPEHQDPAQGGEKGSKQEHNGWKTRGPRPRHQVSFAQPRHETDAVVSAGLENSSRKRSVVLYNNAQRNFALNRRLSFSCSLPRYIETLWFPWLPTRQQFEVSWRQAAPLPRKRVLT